MCIRDRCPTSLRPGTSPPGSGCSRPSSGTATTTPPPSASCAPPAPGPAPSTGSTGRYVRSGDDRQRAPVHLRQPGHRRRRAAGDPQGPRRGLPVPHTALAGQQLILAQNAASGRSSHTGYGGHEHVLRQTVIALAAGQTLDEHENPGEATLHVLHGRVRLGAGETSWDGSPGVLLIVPDDRHTLAALEPAVVLLTVAKHR